MSKVAGFFDYYQWLKLDEVVDGEYLDYGTGENNGVVGNTQVATFDGVGYISGDFTGWTISSYEGLATLTKTSDSRIDVTADQIYSITITDGINELTWYAVEGQGSNIYFIGNSTTLVCSLTSLVLDDVWANKNDLAFPALLAKGGNKYLVCESDGTAIHSADPKGANLGDEIVTNGDFETDSDWNKGSGTTIGGGKALINTLSSTAVLYQDTTEFRNSANIGEIYRVVFNISNYISGSVRIELGILTFSSYYSANNTYYNYIKLLDTSGNRPLFRTPNGGFIGSIDNFSIKKVQSIPLLGIQKFKIKPTISDMYYLDSTDITTGNGYMVRVTPTYITLYRVDLGVLTQLDTDTLAIADYSEITNTFSETGINVAIGGVQVLNSNDLTYTTFKVLVTDNDAGAEILHASKNDVKYINSFCCGTGGYGIQNVIGV